MDALRKPTILLVQGSFVIPEVYEKLVELLRAEGFPVVHPALPSLVDPDSPDFASKSLVDDALAMRLELIRLIDRARSDHRQARDLTGGVMNLVYIAGFLLSEGQSVLGAWGESVNNDLKPNGRYCIKDGTRVLYNDLPPDDAEYWASRLIDQSYAVQKTELTRAAYRYIPSTYIVCENDQAAPPPIQEAFGTSAKAEMRAISTGHIPMLSQPTSLARMIIEAVEKAGLAPSRQQLL